MVVSLYPSATTFPGPAVYSADLTGSAPVMVPAPDLGAATMTGV